jgi:signal-transduction protein with cAMP-binding, CBS, and nucleotidyltransferase domain
MSINPITVSPNDKIYHVVQIFEKNRIGSVFVVQSEKLVGIVTRKLIENRDPRYSENVSDIMSTTVYTIHPDADVKEAESKIFRQRINGLAVVEANHLCGIITRYDLQTRAKNFLETDDEKLKAIFKASDRVKTQQRVIYIRPYRSSNNFNYNCILFIKSHFPLYFVMGSSEYAVYYW